MQATRRWISLGLMGMLAAGCGGGEQDADAGAASAATVPAQATAPAAAPAPPPPPMTAADSAAARARVAARMDSVRAAFARAGALGASEVARLRQDVNATQVKTAQRLGVRASSESEIRRLTSAGRLMPLGDSTQYWILRDMDHSAPYVTPDAHAMLQELGRRFHARLDSLGLPRYRVKITSAIRTDETQADLRRTNSYASQTLSAHEFGTTVDVSHERFAAPVDPRTTGGAAPAWEVEEEQLEEIGKENAKVLQAELGRAILQMRDEGALHVMMENLQPVYHMTIARPRGAAATPAANPRP